MNKFIRNLALFIAGLPLATAKAEPGQVANAPRLDDPSKAVSLRPLNLDINNLFASHRSHSSHSSHRSHSSHYSGTGGSYPSTSSSSTAGVTSPASGSSAAVAPASGAPSRGDASTAQPVAGSVQQPSLSIDEKRQLQVMRVQIRLLSLGLYDGQANGVLDEKTRGSLKLFQNLKHLPDTGLMTTPTLNALGVPAVN
jgi:His-Xaa-Ser repeat protein HxsA